MRRCNRSFEKKTTEGFYLTVEQIHLAVNASVEGQSLSPPDRERLYQKTAKIIAYYQRRNRAARMGHTKTMQDRLRYHGIVVESLPSCVPREFR